jgi:hypothetical protein
MNSIALSTAMLTNEGVNYASAIAQAAAQHGLDPNLLAAVAAQETGGPGVNSGRNIVGDGGHGRGLFQIDDRSHDFAQTPGAMNPQANADYAAGMISNLLKQFGGNIRKALSAYNSGSPDASGTKTTWADGQTLDYADSVLRHYQQLGRGAPAMQHDSRAPHHHHQHGHWRSIMGTDATGHRAGSGMTVDDYINGGSSTP